MAKILRGILWQSFGSPEGPEDVWPFLENVTRGRGIPVERLQLVADQYHTTGGSSPLNALNRELIRRLAEALSAEGIEVPIYFGNRNWHPYLAEAIRAMTDAGINEALVIPTSAYSSYSGCRQYREDLQACDAPFRTHTVKPFARHPLFLEAQRSIVRSYLDNKPDVAAQDTAFIATAHSIPESMARTSEYENQLREVIAATQPLLPEGSTIELAYQSRSGNPRTPWLEPDVSMAIKRARADHPELKRVTILPIGFISDHQEVLYDLDILARATASDADLLFDRLPTAGLTPEFTTLMTRFVQAWLAGEDPNDETPGADHLCGVGCCQA